MCKLGLMSRVKLYFVFIETNPKINLFLDFLFEDKAYHILRYFFLSFHQRLIAMKNKRVDIFFIFGKHWLVLLVYCSNDIQAFPKALLGWVLIEHHDLGKIFEKAIFKKILHFQHLGSHLFVAFPEKSKIIVKESKEEFVGIVDNLAIEDI